MVLADAGTHAEPVVAEYDRDRVENLRQEFPVLKHRRVYTN